MAATDRSYLGAHAAREPASKNELHQMAKRSWVEQGKGMVDINEVRDDMLHALFENYLNKLYGKRRG